MSMPSTEFEQSFDKLLSLGDLDARSSSLQKIRKRARALAADLGDDLSSAQKELVLRAASLGALCEHSEASLLMGKPVPIGDYLSAVSVQKRILAALFTDGLQRRARDVTPRLSEYLAQKHREAAE